MSPIQPNSDIILQSNNPITIENIIDLDSGEDIAKLLLTAFLKSNNNSTLKIL